MLVAHKHTTEVFKKRGNILKIQHIQRRLAQPNLSDKTPNATETWDETLARIYFSPSTDGFSTSIVAAIHQTFYGGKQSIHAALTFRAIIPSDSRIFQLIQENDFKEFKRMIENGEASINDSDPEGIMLLNVCYLALCVCKITKNCIPKVACLETSNPDFAIFLIDNGADLNNVAPNSW